MIKSFKIQGFRGFQSFTLERLGRVNLLVGTNNSGKTSVLEALQLLTSKGDPVALWSLLWRRGERINWRSQRVEQTPLRRTSEVEICHLFSGHEVRHGRAIVLYAETDTGSIDLNLSVEERPATAEPGAWLFDAEDEGQSDLFAERMWDQMVLRFTGTPTPPVDIVPLTRSGGVSARMFDSYPRRSEPVEDNTQFVTTESLSVDELIRLWDRIALTPTEDLVLDALRILDSSIERIAPQSGFSSSTSYRRGGFLVKLKGLETPIPIGSMGDGIWRILSLAIAVSQCRGGFLLVDEIDTGLHHSAMANMWKLLFHAAKRLDVQVFATTHSQDCVRSLAQIAEEADESNPVTLQRIERDSHSSVPFSAAEILVVADREIEVR